MKIFKKRSKRNYILMGASQLLFVVGFFTLVSVANPQQASARSITPMEVETEIVLSSLEVNEKTINELDADVEDKQKAVDEQHALVEGLKVEVQSITDKKESLSKEIELMKAEIEELKVRKAVKEAREAREAREAQLEKQRAVNQASVRASTARTTSTRTPTVTSTERSYVGSSAGNLYGYGYCTWYVKNMRPDLPNNLGNANTWYSRASAQGMSVSSTPRAGAVGTTTRGSLGHVVYVHSVNGDGTINISDMNYRGWNQITYRTVSASEFLYIN